ncbi:MAG TPA: YegP family protein, partial [Candidatus Mcinerneyibacteriales bacterium]|nr:YegP family protein [Candidatus Mcinerneyibacteriales bacterium]
RKESVMAGKGKFEMYQDKKGEFRFRLKAVNGQVIATSEGYTSKKSCLAGIESVRKNAPGADLVETE